MIPAACILDSLRMWYREGKRLKMKERVARKRLDSTWAEWNRFRKTKNQSTDERFRLASKCAKACDRMIDIYAKKRDRMWVTTSV